MGTPTYIGPGGGGAGSSGAVHTVPLAADFPTTVLGAGSVTDSTAALLFVADGHGASYDVQQILHAAPSAPWARYFRIELNPAQKQYLYAGYMIKSSSSGAFVLWSLIHTGTALELQYSRYSSATTRASFSVVTTVDTTGVYWKIEDDNTNFILSASPTGETGTYVPVHSVGRTSYLASYDLVGFAADAYNTTAPNRACTVSILHYDTAVPSYTAGGSSGGGGGGGVTSHPALTSLGWTSSGHTGTASTVAGFDGGGAAVTRAAGTTGLALLDDATQADARTTLGLVPGTDVQAYDAGLASLTGTDTVADRIAYTTAANTWAATAITSYIRGLLDDVDAATARGTLSAISGWTVTVDVQSGTSGTYTAPAGAVVAIVDLWGGSGGGGGGARQDGATAATGGASGQAGEWIQFWAAPAAINGLSWSGGAGGTAGTGRLNTTGNGNSGGVGSDSTFAGRVAGGGAGGGNGAASGGSTGGGVVNAGAPAATNYRTAYRVGVNGKSAALGVVGAGAATGTTAINGMDASGGGGASGGAGGGLSTTAAGAGGAGGAQGSTAGGAGGAATGAAGGNGTTPSDAWLPGSAGGGGGAHQTGAGGNAGTSGRGCGGAGGGAGRTGDGGNGGAGADGGAVIRTICITATA